MFHFSADSMHFSRVTFWVGVLSLLQAATARPGVGGLPQQSSQPVKRQSTTNGVAGLGRTSTVSGTNAQLESTDTVNTLTGEVTSNANGTQTQTFPNTTNSRPVTVNNITSVQVGNYNVAFCGNLTTTVREDLQLLWANMQSTGQATSAGTANVAFQAFFKDDQYTRFIEQMFVNITNGNALQKPGSSTAEAPTIACLTGPGEATESTSSGVRDLYEICSGNPKYAAFYRASSNWIFLCPEFFNFPQQTLQPTNQYCPKVEAGYFVQAFWMRLVQNQMYILMHEILHYYLDSAPYPSKDAVTEVTDINVAFNLAALDAVSNAESYVIYDAMVSAGCSNFPAPTDNDPDECSGECLTKLGSPAADVISISNLTIAGIDADMMQFSSNSTTLPQIGGITQAD